MKILVAYDGSQCAEAAIDDVSQAGLPESGFARVVSVAEVWLPPPDIAEGSVETESGYVEEVVRQHREQGEKVFTEASLRAKHAEARLRAALPKWEVTSSAASGSPAWEILTAADEFETDLIIVGSQGLSVFSRLLLGSISQKVLSEAHCSVRISRGKNMTDFAPPRIVVGFDGSRGSIAAVDAICKRSWPPSSEVRLVAATELVSPGAITRFVPPVARMIEEVNVSGEHWIGGLAEPEIEKIRNAGLTAGLHIHPGNPKDILIEEAVRWGADCIFVGATAHGGSLGGVLLGSTSAAVASRAHCSVEVVRTNQAVESSATNGNHIKR